MLRAKQNRQAEEAVHLDIRSHLPAPATRNRELVVPHFVRPASAKALPFDQVIGAGTGFLKNLFKPLSLSNIQTKSQFLEPSPFRPNQAYSNPVVPGRVIFNLPTMAAKGQFRADLAKKRICALGLAAVKILLSVAQAMSIIPTTAPWFSVIYTAKGPTVKSRFKL